MDSPPPVFIFLDKVRGGGTEAHAVWLTEALQQRGFAAELHTLFAEASPVSASHFVEYPFRRFLKLCERRRPSTVFCFGRICNGLGYRIARKFPWIRVIATCRTNRRLPPAYRRTLREADAVIANSAWAAQRVRGLPGIRPSNVGMILNALLQPELQQGPLDSGARREARRCLRIDDEVPLLCGVAQFVSGKNQKDLIRIFADRHFPPGTTLLLAGEGPRLGVCRRLARRLGCAESVRFIGRIETPESLFRASDVFVSTSLRDSMPNALVEAQAAGLPAVVYDVAGVGEGMRPDSSGYLVPARDRSAFGDALLALLRDGELRTAFGQAARRHVRQCFDREKALEQYVRFLETPGNRV